ncbi:MAG TPA: hypothetical protein VFM18_07555, partial [Methanosarcina sp.]|nr:hypothetical protein [Methanosarcina sp.]
MNVTQQNAFKRKVLWSIVGILLIVVFFSLAACGKKEETAAEVQKSAESAQALVDRLDHNRSVAKSNVSTAAAEYFAANPRFDATWKVMPHTDDYISEACPQGSGWGWVNIMRMDPENPKKAEKYKL